MSADCRSSNTLRAPYRVCLAQTLSEPEQQTSASLLGLLPAACVANVQLNDEVLETSFIHIKGIVDGRGLACPMPLLKTKVALRNVAIGDSLYVVATDPNSQADITAFCRQAQQAGADNGLLLVVNQATHKDTYKNPDQAFADTAPAMPFDTIYHFIITKTDSN
ncbi:sulfurtransferase TusA family protein [Psychrobacter sp. 72-O-c]|uniref:sulfurtransferase TusA family protein n=1 Tax=Psychrobacter sp. 72-O-c TaxID=2774125 RepID=UPI00191AF649|nr:sulfurtransferase TusA family protein [Psychrobacter sp. 72-O-c]